MLKTKNSNNNFWFTLHFLSSLFLLTIFFGIVIIHQLGVYITVAFFNIASSPSLQSNFIREHVFHSSIMVFLLNILIIIWVIATGNVILILAQQRHLIGKFMIDFFRIYKFTLSLILIGFAAGFGTQFLLEINQYKSARFSIVDNKITFINMEEYMDIEQKIEKDRKIVYVNSPLYSELLRTSVGFYNQEDVVRFGDDLHKITSEYELYESVKMEYRENKISYRGRLISKDDLYELSAKRLIDNDFKHRDELWINCYSPSDLKNKNIIKIYDTEAEYLEGKNQSCSPE